MLKLYVLLMLILNLYFIGGLLLSKPVIKNYENDIKAAYCEYNRDVLDLVWACLTYDRRKLAPLGTELILKPFDFRPETISDYVYHSSITKEMNDYLSDDPKNEAVSICIGRAVESWNIYTNAVEKYNIHVRKTNTIKARMYMLHINVKYRQELRLDGNNPDKKDLKKSVRSIYKRND